MPYKTAFMSHAHIDNVKCDPFAEALKQRGVNLYYDRANPQVGHDLGVALEREIERANALVVMVTPASLKSFWVTEEISMFFSLMSQDPSRLLIPVKLDSCKVGAMPVATSPCCPLVDRRNEPVAGAGARSVGQSAGSGRPGLQYVTHTVNESHTKETRTTDG